MSAWTTVAKPTSSVWTTVNPQGKEQYDQASLTYDSASTLYDGVNPAQWSDVSKPVVSSWVSVAKPT